MYFGGEKGETGTLNLEAMKTGVVRMELDNGDVIEYEVDSETWNEVVENVEVAGVEWLTEKLVNRV